MKWLFFLLDSVLPWSEQSAELNVTLEIYLPILSMANLQKWWSVPVPRGLQCPSGIARQPLGLQGGTIRGILQGNFDDVFSLSSFGVYPCIRCSFLIMCRTELIFQSVTAATLHSCRSLELLHIQRCSSLMFFQCLKKKYVRNLPFIYLVHIHTSKISDWMFMSRPVYCVEPVSLNGLVFGGGPLEVLRLRWDHKDEASKKGLVFL